MASNVQWQLSGDYFENCNCHLVCPCLVSPAAPLTSRPTEGVCDVALIIHIEKGTYGSVRLDGLNAVVIGHAPGPMAEGNLTVAVYIDSRANDQQSAALEAILGGAEGGPMAAFLPLISKSLGTKKVPITYRSDGTRRSAEIPGILHMAVQGLPSMKENQEIWASTGHPFNPDKLALAVGTEGSTFSDLGMRWDNSGRNGHYAPINWSNR